MRAVTIPEFGTREVLCVRKIADATPADGEVLIRVVAAAVNPTDTLLRRGLQARYLGDIGPPYVPGMDLAGIVEAAGSGVSGIQIGTSVIGALSAWRPSGGAQAELVSVPAASVVSAPKSISLEEAAALPMNGLTASASLSMSGVPAGGSVAVIGAAGAVGGLAVEMAAGLGLEVIAVARERDSALVTRMGASSFVASGPRVVDEILGLAPGGVDGLIDAANVGGAALRAIRDEGRMIRMMPFTERSERGISVDRVFVVDHLTDTAALARIRDLAEAGSLTPRVAEILRADDVMRAHELIENGGVRGRPILTF